MSYPYSPRRGSFPRDESFPARDSFLPARRLLSSRAAFFLRMETKEIHHRLLFLQRREARRSIAAPVPQRRHLVGVHRCEEDVEVHALLPRQVDHGDRSQRRNCVRRAKELRAKKKAHARRARKFPAKMKDTRTKIVWSTILGNVKSKIPNTWR